MWAVAADRGTGARRARVAARRRVKGWLRFSLAPALPSRAMHGGQHESRGGAEAHADAGVGGARDCNGGFEAPVIFRRSQSTLVTYRHWSAEQRAPVGV